MDEVSVEGALAFGEYFMQLYPYVIATGDTTEWRALSHPECIFCADTATTAETTGFSSTPYRTEVVALAGRELEPGSYFSLDYSVEEWSGGSAEPTSLLALLGVVRENDHWLMRIVDIRAPEELG